MDIYPEPNIYNSLNEAINDTLGIALNGSCLSQEELDKYMTSFKVFAAACIVIIPLMLVFKEEHNKPA